VLPGVFMFYTTGFKTLGVIIIVSIDVAQLYTVSINALLALGFVV